jgi:hypothetical protein
MRRSLLDVGVAVLKVLSFCLLLYSSLVCVNNPKFVPVEDYGIVYATRIV